MLFVGFSLSVGVLVFGSAAMVCYSGFGLGVGGFAVCGLLVISWVLVIVLVGLCRMGLACCYQFGLVWFADLRIRLAVMSFLRFRF